MLFLIAFITVQVAVTALIYFLRPPMTNRKMADAEPIPEAPPTEKGKRSKKLTFSFSMDTNKEIYLELKKALSKKPEKLEIDIFDEGPTSQDFCLLLYDLLKNRKDATTHVTLRVNCNLVDGQLLLACAANQIVVRPHVCFELSNLTDLETEYAKKCDNSFFVGENSAAFAHNYRLVLKILDEYFPTKAFATGRKITLEAFLGEWGLANTPDQEREFQRLFLQKPCAEAV